MEVISKGYVGVQDLTCTFSAVLWGQQAVKAHWDLLHLFPLLANGKEPRAWHPQLL